MGDCRQADRSCDLGWGCIRGPLHIGRMPLMLEGGRFTWHRRQTGYENICATRPRWPQAPADRGSGCEWADRSTISRSSVKLRAGVGDVLDSQQEQVGESTTRLRMLAEGSRLEWQDGRSA